MPLYICRHTHTHSWLLRKVFHHPFLKLQVNGRGVCGGQFTAARELSRRSSGSSNIDEEGLEIAVCRHGVLLGALNMYRGEIFAYPLYLQKQLANRNIMFFCMDVTCKYWPYLRRVAEKCPELKHLLDMKPFLSVFHAKAHDFKCEVMEHYHMMVLLHQQNIDFNLICALYLLLYTSSQVNLSGNHQHGAGLTLGEEVRYMMSLGALSVMDTF